MNHSDSGSPRDHAFRARRTMENLVEQLSENGRDCRDPKAQALFETSAEVLHGLIKAFEHYDQKSEKAWR